MRQSRETDDLGMVRVDGGGVHRRGVARPLAKRHCRGTRGFVAALALVAVAVASTVAHAPAAFASSNVNFVGVWKVSGSALGFEIRSENLKTGACAGKTTNPSYHLTDCRVTGNWYAFTIVVDGGYRSRNVGTVFGNTMSGRFTDSNGTSRAYTASR